VVAAEDVVFAVASKDTRRSTELALRSIRSTVPAAVEVWVGDCGSTDGSWAMLERLRARGLVDRLERAEGRSHGQWIDHWRSAVARRYLVVADSDVELLQPGWLEQLIGTLDADGVGLMSVGTGAAGSYTQRDTFTMRTVVRPEMYLMALDQERTRGVEVSFDFSMEQTDDGGWVAWDTGAAFGAALHDRGIGWAAMPPAFAATVRHWGALSHLTEDNRLPSARVARLRVRLHRVRVELRVWRRLVAARRDVSPSR
jgi:glycosyltransferase involved in cell wall biosynthesis